MVDFLFASLYFSLFSKRSTPWQEPVWLRADFGFKSWLCHVVAV